MSSSRKTELTAANETLKMHVPLLIRWGVACLMVIGTLMALVAKGEGEMNFVAAATFFALWLLCLWKAAQSAFTVGAALIDKQRSSRPD